MRIVTELRDETVLAPKIALVTDRGETVVFIAADSTAERRVIEVGFEDDDNIEILSGVSPGEPVVVKGQRSLKHGSPIKILVDELETGTKETVDPETTAHDARRGDLERSAADTSRAAGEGS